MVKGPVTEGLSVSRIDGITYENPKSGDFDLCLDMYTRRVVSNNTLTVMGIITIT